MEGSMQHFILLTFTCAFSSCFAEVALGVEVSPETTPFHHAATSAQPLSFYHSSSSQGTTVRFNSTGSLEITPISHRTTLQTTDQHQVTTAPGHHTTSKAGGTTTQVTKQNSTVVSTTPADGEATNQAMETVAPTVKNTTIYPMSSTKQGRTHLSTKTTAAAINTTPNNTTPNTQMTAAAITTTAISMQTVKPTTGSGNQTTAPKGPTTTATTDTTPTHPGTQTPIPSATTPPSPAPAPQPAPIPTGTYVVTNGTSTCIKVVVGLQLMAQNTQKARIHTAPTYKISTGPHLNCISSLNEQKTIIFCQLNTPEQKRMEYVVVNPNRTLTSGSCGMVESELNITFSGGFVNFTFVKQAPSYYVSKIGTSLQLSSEGMLYYAAIEKKLFPTKLGNSFKCTSKQIFSLEKNFQLLFVNMQLQAFDMVSNQFGKEEECFPDKNSRAAPIAVGLSILGLFVIVFATFLISRRKPHRGYERI